MATTKSSKTPRPKSSAKKAPAASPNPSGTRGKKPATAPSHGKRIPARAKAKALGKKPRVKWGPVEADYRTGQFTLEELEAKHHVNMDTICRKAKTEGWTKDLAGVIREQTTAFVIGHMSGKARMEVEASIAAVAETNAQVILGHRKDIKSLRDQCFTLLSELQAANGTMEQLTSVLDTMEDMETSLIEGDEDLSGRTKDARIKRLRKNFDSLRRMAMDAADIHNRVGSAQKLMDIIVKAQGLERKAFNLDAGNDGQGFESLLERALA